MEAVTAPPRGAGARLARAVREPRGVLAPVQRARARAGRGRARPAARAREVPRDLRRQPRRVLHGPGGRACTTRWTPASTPAAPTACPPARRSSGSPSARASSAAGTSRAWEEEVRPALAEHGIRVVDIQDCSDEELEAIDRLFAEQIFPVLTPLAVGPGPPVPLHLEPVALDRRCSLRDPVSGLETFARVKVPKEVLPRFVPIGDDTFVPLESRDRAPPRRALPGHGDPAPRLLPGHARRRLHGLGRGRRPAARGGGRAAAQALRRGRAARGRRRRWTRTCASYLIEQLAIDDDAGGRLGRPARPERPDVAVRDRRPPRAALRAVDAGRAARVRRRGRRRGGRARRDARAATCSSTTPTTRSPAASSASSAGRGGPGRAGDQDHRVPHLRRLGARPGPDRGGRARQAGRLPRGAEGALRRAPQHRLGARPSRRRARTWCTGCRG